MAKSPTRTRKAPPRKPAPKVEVAETITLGESVAPATEPTTKQLADFDAGTIGHTIQQTMQQIKLANKADKYAEVARQRAALEEFKRAESSDELLSYVEVELIGDPEDPMRGNENEHVDHWRLVPGPDRVETLYNFCTKTCEGKFVITEQNKFFFELPTDALNFKKAWAVRHINPESGEQKGQKENPLLSPEELAALKKGSM